jgi:hypothetical protein
LTVLSEDLSLIHLIGLSKCKKHEADEVRFFFVYRIGYEVGFTYCHFVFLPDMPRAEPTCYAEGRQSHFPLQAWRRVCHQKKRFKEDRTKLHRFDQ